MPFLIKSKDEGSLNKADILHLLGRLDGFFRPPLSSRVDLGAYSEKLISRAEIDYMLSDGREIAGLIAYYCNDAQSKVAYITYLGLLPEYHGKGMAGKLLDACISRCMLQNMHEIVVYTDEMNEKAIGLYKSRGFETSVVSSDRWCKGLNSIKLQKDLYAGGVAVI